MLCSKCQKNMAVVFITKLEGDNQTNEGLCLKCAKAMGIAPLDQFMDQMGINEEDLESLNDEFGAAMEELEGEYGEGDDNGAKNPMALLSKMFQNGAPSAIKNENAGAKEDKKTKNEEKNSDKSSKQSRKKGKKKALDVYGLNLTAKAAAGEIDRVVGRNFEIDRVVQILNRRTKNNPVLLGEPGVGKTAIAEGLAMRIFEKKVPPKLFGCEVYLLDFTALVAGTQFRGQFEARLKSIIEEVKSLGNVILVIDELHNIVGAGDADGAMSAANILKPALARGEIQVVGATTLSEYRKHIEKDSALERRFQTVIVDEPSIEDSIKIVEGIKDYYENYHHVKITDEIVEYAVKLSERYISDRFLPDKAIDVIDEAGSRANLKNLALIEIENLKEELEDVRRAQEIAAENEKDKEPDIYYYQKTAELNSKEISLEEEIEKRQQESSEVYITADDIASVIEAWTKIPVQRITEPESEKLLNMEQEIHKRIIGQDHAVESVCRAVRRRRAAISKQARPVSFIFVGPTGVGKTELVKALSEVMFNSRDAIIRFDMSEYSEKHTVAKLIGAPPGYVGYDDAGQLTEKVRRKPYSIILLDEIEKAHPEVFNILLQILDDGRITDSHGKTVSFENTIIVMTSNAGSDLKTSTLGFSNNADYARENKIDTDLKSIFRPEFLNRVDEIVMFKQLTKPELIKIIDLMIDETFIGLKDKNIKINVTDDAKQYVLRHGYDAKYGARPLRRVIQQKIEDAVAHMLIKGELKAGDSIKVYDDNDTIKVDIM